MILDARGSYDPDGLVGNLEWRFDDGGIYFGSPAYNTFAIPGFHDVELRVYDSRGGVGVTHILIHVQSSVAGDLDGDSQLGAGDVNALSEAIANGSDHPAFDVNGDSLVNLDDLHYWVVNLKGTLMGDANLDATVDGEDFIAWNNNKFTNTTAWTDGNFNGDSFVDGSDFIVWNANKFQSASPNDFLHDPQPVASTVWPHTDRSTLMTKSRESLPGPQSSSAAVSIIPPVQKSRTDGETRFQRLSRRSVEKVFADGEDEDIFWKRR